MKNRRRFSRWGGGRPVRGPPVKEHPGECPGTGLGRSGRPRAALRSRDGILLPVALILLLGGTLMAAALLVMARSAIVLADGDRHLAQSLGVRAPLSEGGGAWTGGGEIVVQDLPGGYRLLSRPAPGVSWSVWSVGWVPAPARIAAGLPAVASVGWREGDVEGELLGGGAGEGCPDPFPLDRWWVRGSFAPPAPDPGLPSPPRLGPVGLEALIKRGDETLTPGELLMGSDPRIIVVPAGRSIPGGEGVGLLVGEGDLELTGDTHFQGLVMVGGDLAVTGEATIMGAVKTGGGLVVGPQARIVGCRSWVQDTLEGVDGLRAPFPIPGGHFLGRH